QSAAPQCADPQRRRRAEFSALLYRAYAGVGVSADGGGDVVWLAGDGGAAVGAGFDSLLYDPLAANWPARWNAAYSACDLAGDFADDDVAAAFAGGKRYGRPAGGRNGVDDRAGGVPADGYAAVAYRRGWVFA